MKICNIEVSDEQYLKLLDIMKRNSLNQIIPAQINHFKESGWFAMNTSWYKLSAQKRWA